MTTTTRGAEPVLHRAARAEDALNRTLARLLRRRGWRPRIIAYTGYGSSAPAGGSVGVLRAGPGPGSGDGSGAGPVTGSGAGQGSGGGRGGGSGSGWVRVLARVLLSPPGVASGEDVGTRGWRHFLSAKLGGVPVTVDVGGRRHVVESGRGGYVDAVVEADLPPGWTTVRLCVNEADQAEAPVRVVGPDEHFGVISDIDDTVLVTALPRPLLAFWNTFVRPEESRRPVPGMADLFRTLMGHHPDAFVVYVSTGAWNLAPALTRFLRRGDFPLGPLLMTDWGPTPEGWFRSGQDHKRSTLRRLVDELPQLRWVLVGDDGQHDPQLYDEIAWARPAEVRLVAIRQLAATEQVLTHGTPLPLSGPVRGAGSAAGKGVPWVRAADGHALVAELGRRPGRGDDLLR